MAEKTTQNPKIQKPDPTNPEKEASSAFVETPGEQTFPNVGQEEEKLPDRNNNIPRNLDFILDIPLEISIVLGRATMRIADILKLGQGSVIELTNPAGSSLEFLVNQKPIAKGEVVVVNEKYGIRLVEILSIMERIEKLK